MLNYANIMMICAIKLLAQLATLKLAQRSNYKKIALKLRSCWLFPQFLWENLHEMIQSLSFLENAFIALQSFFWTIFFWSEKESTVVEFLFDKGSLCILFAHCFYYVGHQNVVSGFYFLLSSLHRSM